MKLSRKLFSDVIRARLLLQQELSWDTEPKEKEARAAARTVLETIGKDLEDRGTHEEIVGFLRALANAIDPIAMPEAERPWTRQIHFSDSTTRSRATAAVSERNLKIATEVYLRKRAGNYLPKACKKGGLSGVAANYKITYRQLNRICAEAETNRLVESHYGKLTAAEAAEAYLRLVARQETSKP